MLEVFNSKLQLSNEIAIDESALASLLEPMVQLATGVGEPNVFNQQLALLCLRSFGKAIGPVSPGPFTEVSSWRSTYKPTTCQVNVVLSFDNNECFLNLFHFSGLQEAVRQKVFVLPGQPGRQGRHPALPHRALSVARAVVRSTSAAVHQLDVGADG